MHTDHFVVRRDRVTEHKMIATPRADLIAGEVELRIDRFGLTANNVTYGVLGDTHAYWACFPVAESGWGRLPVWGFGTIARSAIDGVAVGDRYYGYFPMSSHLVVEPRRVDDVGFHDGVAHRRRLGGVYNQYLRTSRDPSYRADTEAYQVVLRPLFATAYFLADFLAEHRFFDADAVLVSSASSKLAYATAWVLRGGAAREGRTLVGLTSARNVEFVRGLALYDRVVPYEDVPLLPDAARAVLIDIAGNRAVRAAVHHRLGDMLRHSSTVGTTHWEASEGSAESAELPGPRPTAFFAPDWIRRRASEWSATAVQGRLAEAWHEFIERVSDPSHAWMSIVEGTGAQAVARVYDQVVAGRARPRDGHVLSLAVSG